MRSASIPAGAALSAYRVSQACASRTQPLRTLGQRQYHDTSKERTQKPERSEQSTPTSPTRQEVKTMAQQDDDLRARLEAMSGEGGAAGVEYENGTAEGLKKNVKRNMFRVI